MSTLSGILILLILIFGIAVILCFPIKDGNVSIVCLGIGAICALLLLLEGSCSDIEKIDIGEAVIVGGRVVEYNQVQVKLHGSDAYTDMKAVGMDVTLIENGTEGVVVYQYRKTGLSKEILRNEPVFVPFEYGSVEFNRLFDPEVYEVTVLK